MLRQALLILTASEVRSAIFRERGIPSLDTFAREVVDSFRRGVGHTDGTEGLTRKFMPVFGWGSDRGVMTVWTIKPVVATVNIRGNSTDVSTLRETYEKEILVAEPMSSRTSATLVVAGNEIRGRWAGWLVGLEVDGRVKTNDSRLYSLWLVLHTHRVQYPVGGNRSYPHGNDSRDDQGHGAESEGHG